MTDFRVAALIINWKSSLLLKRCLDCLINQESITPDIFVLDNNGQDPLPAEIAEQFPTVRFYSSESNMGFAGGNNFLLEKTRGYPWIVLVNPDAFLKSDWLKIMRQATDAYPRYSSFASRLIQANHQDTLDGEGDVMHASGLAWRLRYGVPLNRGAKNPMEVFSTCAAASLYRRDALDDVQGFDEDYFCYFEDVDLGFRLCLAGYRCLLVPEAVAYHVGSATTGGRHSDFAVYHGHRNLVWTYVKNMPGPLFWLLLPLHVLLNIVSIVWFLILGKARLILQAKTDACKGLPRMWKKRRIIQKHRRVSVGNTWMMLDKSLLPRLNRRWW